MPTLKNNLKQIKARYILALSLVGALVTGSVLMMENIFRAQYKDAEYINISGMQRMLSQKISLYVSKVISEPDSVNSEQHRVMLKKALDKFQKNHQWLTSTATPKKSSRNLSEQIKHLYYSKEIALDRRVREFVNAAEKVLFAKASKEDLTHFSSNNSEALLVDLNKVVEQFEAEATGRVSFAVNGAWALWFVTVILLLIEGRYIFQPMLHKVASVLSRIEKQKMLAEKYRERAEKANRIKSEFLANMSHELRTPMNAISAALQIVTTEPLSPQAKHLVELADASSIDLLEIFDDLLGITKIDDQSKDLTISHFKLSNVLKSVVRRYQSQIDAKKLKLDVSTEAVSLNNWLGDETELTRVLCCLLSNSIKFTEKGEISITVSMVETDTTEKQLCFEIQDTGIGMSEAVQSTMFQRFEQGDNTSSRKYGGIGVGLTIARHLVEIMHGTINIDSEEGKGTKATVVIPLIPGTVNGSGNKEVNVSDELDLNGKDILIAEDNLINQMVILSLLESTKANTRMAENGQQVVDMYKEKRPDIVLLDIQMPIKDGIDACVEIKGMDKDVPVIAVTANVSDEDKKTYVRVGFDGLIEKPIDNKELLKVLSMEFS
ncbi:ATP-binding protein [Litoribrevibacter albus]|uniref:histidine kinase n=1 Tax=Litoribrevibacter albus TaxID=1473156 RepID=A0AA37S977_9GAMM|nr:ATP-binding protein [Litoribrevibacter albus]GLQ31717.1 hypothetical protein GCM10007876_21960 [Litoribrevibacter albus]